MTIKKELCIILGDNTLKDKDPILFKDVNQKIKKKFEDILAEFNNSYILKPLIEEEKGDFFLLNRDWNIDFKNIKYKIIYFIYHGEINQWTEVRNSLNKGVINEENIKVQQFSHQGTDELYDAIVNFLNENFSILELQDRIESSLNYGPNLLKSFLHLLEKTYQAKENKKEFIDDILNRWKQINKEDQSFYDFFQKINVKMEEYLNELNKVDMNERKLFDICKEIGKIISHK